MNKKLKTRGASLLQSLAGIRPWGKKKGGKRRKKKTILIRPGKIAFDLLLCFLVITIVPVLIYSAVDPSTTALMWIRWSQSDHKKDLPRAFTHWVKLENISPHLMKAVISSEDQKFFQHRGFDWQAIESAIVTNFTDGDIYRWGSIMAGALIGSLPLVILYAFFVEHYVAAMSGAVKE